MKAYKLELNWFELNHLVIFGAHMGIKKLQAEINSIRNERANYIESRDSHGHMPSDQDLMRYQLRIDSTQSDLAILLQAKTSIEQQLFDQGEDIVGRDHRANSDKLVIAKTA
jgi:hypothetical protein